MKTKKVLGLDIGTNSIGAALINLPKKYENYGEVGNIEWLGSRIIPTDGDYLQKFESGAQAETKAAFRRGKRGSRRLKHRYKLRRTRLIKILKTLDWIDENFPLDESRQFKKSINDNGYSLKISDYLSFSEETISEFEKELGIDGNKSKKGKSIVPEDWIVYFLRKKALKKQITIPELVRIIYLLNQRRGFKSSRKDLRDTNVLPYVDFVKSKENKDWGENGIETQFVAITKIKSVTFKEEKKVKDKVVGNVYVIEAEDARMQPWEETRKKEPDWAKEVNDKGEKIERKEFTFLVVQKVDKNGKSTQLKPQMPKDTDWALCTTALSEKIQEKDQHPGEYFFDELQKAYKANRNYKIRQYPVYRWRYQKELEAIWNKQCEFNPELKKLNSDKTTLTKLAEILYPTQAKHNMSKLKEFQSKDLLHIISNDIIYYQRELKSQKNSISECRYEKRKGIDEELYGLKCIPRSSPLFQEFRIWQDIHNIKILKREEKIDGKTKLDIDVTALYINDIVKDKLFELFNSKVSISEKDILILIKESNEQNNIVISDKKDGEHSHRINLFVNRDSLKGNETLSRYRSVFSKANYDGKSVLNDPEKLFKLWHIDYSVTSSDEEKSKKGFTSALSNEQNKRKKKKTIHFNFPENVIEAFSKLPELKKEYGSYSACAIKKLLPVMRCGKYWKEQDISEATTNRAAQIEERLNNIDRSIRRLNEIADDDVQKQVLKSFIGKENLTKGLNTYQAGYLIYDRHSEKDRTPINNTEEFSKYIQKEIPNNSLGNPIVEQVVRETMFLVRDVWEKYGDIDEIHIELGRDLKKNAEDKFKIAERQKANNEENQRIKKLLYELMNGFEQYVDDGTKENTTFEVKPNPESPVDIDKFRIWKENSLVNKNVLTQKKNGEKTIKITTNKDEELEKLFKDGKKEKIPTNAEVKKYALWLSQNCRSPYTGKIIPLSKLFDINQYEIEHVIPRKKMKNDSFNNLVISEWGVNKAKGSELASNFISISNGKCKYGDTEYKLFSYEEYEAYCKGTFKFQKGKLKNLLATEVPDDFIERQLNDTRHIGRKLAELLTPVAKSENGIIFTGGSITSELKNNWGLNKIWKQIILPRFERLEEITNKKGEYIIHDKDQHGNPVIHLNVKENPQLDTKRIDHRHHALDALIIAATTREHIRYLNTLNAADTDDEIKKYKQSLVKGKIRDFKEPWKNFTKDAREKLEEVIVSFKTNNKIISQPKNRIEYLKVENGKATKEFKEQKANPKWMSVRKSMFKEPLGVIWLKETKEVSVFDAFKIHIEKKLADSDKEKRKTASYVYDKQARQIIDDVISKANFALDEQNELLKEIKSLLDKNSQKVVSGKINTKGKSQNKTVYILNGVEYEKVKIAHFVSYKTKRMDLAKKDYVEKLTIEKMKGDFPYFTFVGENYFNSLSKEKQSLITKANLEISEHRKLNAFNQLFLEHILDYDNNAKEAFSAEGLEKLNKKALENPKIGKEIKSVTRLDGTVDIEDMFNGGFYETDKGSNVYFVMYENQNTKERIDFDPKSNSISTHKAIEKIVNGQPIAEDKEGFDTIILSPGDLVYVPTKDEKEECIDWSNKKNLIHRIYKVGRFSKKQCYFLKANVADLIISYDAKLGYGEYGSTNYQELDDGKNKIAEICIKLKVDRLGNISKA